MRHGNGQGSVWEASFAFVTAKAARGPLEAPNLARPFVAPLGFGHLPAKAVDAE